MTDWWRSRFHYNFFLYNTQIFSFLYFKHVSNTKPGSKCSLAWRKIHHKYSWLWPSIGEHRKTSIWCHWTGLQIVWLWSYHTSFSKTPQSTVMTQTYLYDRSSLAPQGPGITRYALRRPGSSPDNAIARNSIWYRRGYYLLDPCKAAEHGIIRAKVVSTRRLML
jgi:hypothetical protein